jgi:hypothetical protein
MTDKSTDKERTYVVCSPITGWECRGTPEELAMMMNAVRPSPEQVAAMKELMIKWHEDGGSPIFVTLPSGYTWRLVGRVEQAERAKKGRKSKAKS